MQESIFYMYTKGEKNEVNGRCITHLHLIYIHPNYQNYFNLVMINPDIYYSSFFSETTKSGIPTSDVILEETYYTNAESFRFKWHYAPNIIYLRICSINMSPKTFTMCTYCHRLYNFNRYLVSLFLVIVKRRSRRTNM